jgi:hypothetical protein
MLSWAREKHVGWFVGLYESEERRTTEGPLRGLEDSEGVTREGCGACTSGVARRISRLTSTLRCDRCRG